MNPLIDTNELHKEIGGQIEIEYDSLTMSLLANLQPGDHIAATRTKGMYEYEHHG